MKRLLLAVLCIVGFSSARPIWVCDNAAGQSGHKYRGVCVINDSLAWVVGEAGQVWKRTGGTYSNSWIHIDTLPNEYQFNDVFFINENTGWIVGAGTQDTLKYRGIIYKTTNGGDDWDDQTPALASDPYPTPFLKVQFIDGDVGYITCGNGRVIKTENGGFTWTRTSSDPWNDTNNASVWYNGLSVYNSTSLWVSGDAFGVMAKTTNGGASWTTYQPSVFMQNYTFPQGAVTPYNTRLANFSQNAIDMSTIKVGLSNGKIGVTTNGGASWDTTRYEPDPVWVLGSAILSDSETYIVGTHHVVNVSGTQEHNLDNESHGGFATVPLYCIDFSDSRIGYTAGKGDNYFNPILQGYDPAGFVFDSLRVDTSMARVRLYWSTTVEHNTDRWGIEYRTMNPIVTITNNLTVPAAGHASSYACTTSSAGSDCSRFYLTLKLYTKDNIAGPFQIYYGPEEIIFTGGVTGDTLSPPDTLIISDTEADEGGSLTLTWSSVVDATKYYVGRSENPTGPFEYYFNYNESDTVWVDSCALQNGKSYYYIVLAANGFARNNSLPSDTVCGIPLDNLRPNAPTFTTSSCIYMPDANLIRLEWNAPSASDVAGYWVCPMPPGESDYILNHASPIDHRIYYVPVDSTWQGWCEFFVAAMDYSGNISNWSAPCSIYVVSTIDTSTSGEATAYNNGRNTLRTANFWACYESNSTIFVKKSTDEGKTWSNRMQLGYGHCPSISANTIEEADPPPCVAWWGQGNNDTIFFAKYSSGASWSTPTIITSSGNDLGPPSIVIGSDDYCYLAYHDNTTIKFLRFDIDNPRLGTPDSVGQGSCPSIGYMPAGSGYPEVHVAWEASSNIQYRAKTLSSGWSSTESLFSNGQRPCLEVVGSVVHVVYDSSATDIWHSKTTYTPLGHQWSSSKVAATNDASKYAVITGGNAIAWVEELTGNKEIYYSTYETGDGWSSGNTITETCDNSNYVHITEKQTQNETRLYFVWTEGNNSPYDILFKWQTHIHENNRDGSDDHDLPFYVAYCGEETASPFNMHRDGYLQYGREPYERIDYDAEYLEYQFEMLRPDRDYAIQTFLYHEGMNSLTLSAKINETQIAQVNLPANELVVYKNLLPAALYNDGTIHLKIFGNNAVSAIIALYEYEPERGGCSGGPQSAATLQMEKVLFDGIYPNPFTGDINLTFTLPYTQQVAIKLYDVTGRVMRNVCSREMRKGLNELLLETKEFAAGVYFVRIETDTEILTEKVIMVR